MGTEVKNRKKRKTFVRRALLGALLLIVPLFFLTGRSATSFDRNVIREYGDPEAPAPEIQAEAASIYSLDMDRSVFEKNGDKKIDPYSITKILTCYLALENLDPKQEVTISAKTAEQVYEDGAYILLFEGEKMTVDDLLHATMLSSANDAAYALAEIVGGSQKEFAKMMNDQVKEWGCTNTNFVNPNGWKNKNHYTTAHDMAVITARCFENDDLRKLSMEKEYTIPATNKFEAKDLFNVFMKSTEKIDNITCGKTGSWEEDDCSIVLEFEENYIRAAMVLLRDTMKKRPSDIKKLMEFSHRVTPGFIVAEEGDVVCKADVKGGAVTETNLAFDKTVFAYPKDSDKSAIKVSLEADGIEAPLKAGQKVGTYSVMVDDKELTKGDLLAEEDVEKGWFLSRFYISNKETLALGLFIVCIIIFEVILSLLTSKRRTTYKGKH